MPIEKTEALVIKSIDWSDTSKILSFYTRESGRVKAVAKGARRRGSPFGGALELFYHIDLVYHEKENRGLQTVSHAGIRNAFPGIKRDLVKTAYCSYFAQAVDEISGEKDKSAEVFQLLLEIFGYLEDNEPHILLGRFFELNLLKAAGYGPVVKNCGACGGKFSLPVERAGFSPGAGGAVCEACLDVSRGFLQLSGGAFSTLSLLDRTGPGLLGRLHASKTVADELRDALSCCLEYHLGKKLKAKDFLEEILRDGQF